MNFGVKFAVNFAPKSTNRKFYQPINGLNSKVNNMATGAVATGKFLFIIRKWRIMKYLKYFLTFFYIYQIVLMFPSQMGIQVRGRGETKMIPMRDNLLLEDIRKEEKKFTKAKNVFISSIFKKVYFREQ